MKQLGSRDQGARSSPTALAGQWSTTGWLCAGDVLDGKIVFRGFHVAFRSIGDLELKKYGVTARPELRSVRIKHGKDQFLALTSDGINFVMRDEEVVDCINKCEGAKEGAARLVDQVRGFFVVTVQHILSAGSSLLM